ncbi:MAG: VOC family protein [Chloroflexota bacterium]|nr:VOC family protein [Chloroflexota bacterium]
MEDISHIKAKYRHTNIIARDWCRLAEFYEHVFGCTRVLPERQLSGKWLEMGTGVRDACLSGIHLRLPGCGDCGPTLEIFQYSDNETKLSPVANREGFGHIAFEVDDVRKAMVEVLDNGGARIGEITESKVDGVGILIFVYLADPEGNIIELQSWK